VAEELFEGFFRVIFALLRAIARFLWEILREALGDLMLRAIGWLFTSLFRAVELLFQFAVRVLDALYREVFRPKRPLGDTPALLHATAICVLMAVGFLFGATASTFYHADWSAPDIVASTAVER
jgi:hypothetical protein